MTKYLIVSIITILSYSKLSAQLDSVTHNRISISTGLNLGFFKDLNFSPLNYATSGTNYRLTYLRNNSKNIFLTSVDFNNNKANTTQDTGFPESEYIQGKLKIAYLKKINKISNRINFFLGGQYQSNINYIDFLDESTTFLVAHSIDISLFGEYRFNKKHAINTSLSFPLITLMVRPPFSGFDETLKDNLDKPLRLITNGNLASINKYIAPSLSMQYEYTISNKFSAFGEYQVNYQKLVDRDTFTAFQNQLQIGIYYNF
jgi:hypothetical protein